MGGAMLGAAKPMNSGVMQAGGSGFQENSGIHMQDPGTGAQGGGGFSPIAQQSGGMAGQVENMPAPNQTPNAQTNSAAPPQAPGSLFGPGADQRPQPGSSAAYPGGPTQAQGYGQGSPSGTPGAPNSAQGPTINNEQTGNFNTNYIDPAKSAVHEIAGGPAYDAQVRDAYYNEQKAMLDPQWQQRQADTENQLANMGLSRGSPAWNREKARMDQSQQQAYSSAQNQAIMAGGAESSRLQAAEIARGNFANQAGQQDYQNQVTSQQAQNAGNTAQQQAAQGWQGFRTSEKNADTSAKAQVTSAGLNASAATAAANANAATAREAAQLQYQLGQRGMENSERQMDFDQSLRMARFPTELENLQMQGMFPTGNPNFASFQGGNIPGANQASYAEQINAGNSQGNAGLGGMIQAGASLGGQLINRYNQPPPPGQFNYGNESVSGTYP